MAEYTPLPDPNNSLTQLTPLEAMNALNNNKLALEKNPQLKKTLEKIRDEDDGVYNLKFNMRFTPNED